MDNYKFEIAEDMYMELKIKAAKERKSVAGVIREKLSKKRIANENKKDVLVRFKRLGKKIGKDNPGLNLSKALIEMRYEQ